jgi:hypothetical protein
LRSDFSLGQLEAEILSKMLLTTDITSTTGIALIGPAPAFFRFCATPVVPAQVVAGRRPAKTCAGTTGIAEHLENIGAGPSSARSVVEVKSVLIPAAD